MPLSAREFALLEALLARPGAILSRAQLEDKLYGWSESVESNAVEVHIHALRKQARRRSDPQRARRRLDGRQARSEGRVRSIRRELLVWLLLGLALAIIVAAIGTYMRAREEANALFDYQLKEMAASLTDAPFVAAPASAGSIGSAGSDALVVQIWDRNGVQLFLSQPHRVLPQNAQLGFTTIDTESGQWRVFSTLAAGQVVQVAQPMSARRELAASMALRTIVPLLAVLPFLAALIWLTIARGLRPLDRVAAAVAKRSPTAARVGRRAWVAARSAAAGARAQRAASAVSAARSTRSARSSPTRRTSCARRLTAVHLQAQLAERATTDAERSAALAELKGGLERATRLVEQMLTLAREEPGVTDSPTTRVDLASVAREVIGDLAPLAGAKRIDLGLSVADAGDPSVQGDAQALRTLVSTSSTTRFATRRPADASTSAVGNDARRASLAVRDNGPGIPPADRDPRVRPLLSRQRRRGRRRQRPRPCHRQAHRRATRRGDRARPGDRRRGPGRDRDFSAGRDFVRSRCARSSRRFDLRTATSL